MSSLGFPLVPSAFGLGLVLELGNFRKGVEFFPGICFVTVHRNIS